MARFKMIHVDVGDEVQVSFLCQHCTVDSSVELSPADAYNSPYHNKLRTAGECHRCHGTGFDPAPLLDAKICRACGGTSVCPHCGGDFMRNWTELPIETQERFLKNWERDGTYPKNYAAPIKFYTTFS
jgi:hypothetical protein